MMKRETTNRIRFILEDCLPPFLHDSKLFLFAAKLFWGEHIEKLNKFRERATYLSPEEYTALYRDHPRVHPGSDNSENCVQRIMRDSAKSKNICDVGCGTGELLRRLKEQLGADRRYVGVDFVIEEAATLPGVEFHAAQIENLPFADGEFDTVICTHTLEHILKLGVAIEELRRISHKQLIIVVPREREYKYTFNPHFNFFPYTHSFLKVMYPSPENHTCELIGRDIYYREIRENDT